MERKLASIQRIVDIQPIPKADRLSKAVVLGWEVCINNADNMNVGDKVVYFEVDSILPERPEFEFLRERKFRIKTIRLRSQVSQGLVMPLSILQKGNYEEGQDVTQLLGVTKYDPEGQKEQELLEESLKNKSNKISKFLSRFPWYRRLFSFFMPRKASCPKFITKTDETRIQLFPDICEKEKDTLFELSEKLDGQSLTVFLVKNKNRFLWFGSKYIFGVCSRNLYLPVQDNSSYWTIARKYELKSVLEELIEDKDFVVLQGEILGPGIQKNKYGLKEYDMYAFNLIYPDHKVEGIIAEGMLRDLGVKFVPLLTLSFKLKPTIAENVEYAKGKSILADVRREGIVFRNYDKNISYKVINPDFLIEYEE